MCFGATVACHPLSVEKNAAMKKAIFNLHCIVLAILLACSPLMLPAQMPNQTVNAVLGDESFVYRFGFLPDEQTPEQLRIQTHLAYVEDILRSQPVGNLSPQQQLKRAQLINLLQEYREAGKFPVNRDYPQERRPCFIDADGNICAVGYLLAKTWGHDAAEDINSRNQYAFIYSMQEPMLLLWAEEYGLTLEECAMIQPAYGPPPPPQTSYADLKPAYGISSGALGGINLASNLVLLSCKGSASAPWAYAGMIGGGGQLVLGLANIRKANYSAGVNGYDTYTRYRAQNNLSYLNIAMGTATLLHSGFRLIRLQQGKSDLPLNVYGYPNEANSITMGIYFAHRF